MSVYSYQEDKLEGLEKTTFVREGILERYNLQQALKKDIDIIAPDCLVISEEFCEWSNSKKRIDLLAIDKEANIVVIELKRDETGEKMELQALRYAAMVSTLTIKQAVEIFQKYLDYNHNQANAKDVMLEFLGWSELDDYEFGVDTKIVLVASDFSKELTTSVMWLNERDLDITCIRLKPYKYQGKLLVDIQQIIPLPEAESYQVKLKEKNDERRENKKKSNKDYSKYLFNNIKYNKRKLVLAIIKDYVTQHSPKSYEELNDVFPEDIHRGGIFCLEETAIKIYERSNIERHFLDYVITLDNGCNYVVTNQWGAETFDKFVECAVKVGYEIEQC